MNPWEQTWGEVAPEAPVSTTQAAPTSSSEKAIMPWLQSWGATEAPQRPVEAAKPLGQGLTLDSTYERLLLAESGRKHRGKNGELITSPVGAQGISQVMPRTGTSPGYGVEPLKDDSEEEYRRFGKDYLSAMYKEFGSMEKAVAAYNAGPRSVTMAVNKAKNAGGDWKDHLPKKSETLPYMKKILGAN